MLTDQLAELFERNFEAGLADSFQRPAAGTWARALSAAADRTLACRKSTCKHTYYESEPACPFCGTARSAMIPVVLCDQVPAPAGHGGGEPMFLESDDLVALQKEDPFVLTTRHSRLVSDHPGASVLRLRWSGGDQLHVENLGAREVRLVPPTGGQGQKLPPGKAHRMDLEWRVHLDRVGPWRPARDRPPAQHPCSSQFFAVSVGRSALSSLTVAG